MKARLLSFRRLSCLNSFGQSAREYRLYFVQQISHLHCSVYNTSSESEFENNSCKTYYTVYIYYFKCHSSYSIIGRGPSILARIFRDFPSLLLAGACYDVSLFSCTFLKISSGLSRNMEWTGSISSRGRSHGAGKLCCSGADAFLHTRKQLNGDLVSIKLELIKRILSELGSSFCFFDDLRTRNKTKVTMKRRRRARFYLFSTLKTRLLGHRIKVDF